MTSNALRPPPNLQPRSKAAPTTSEKSSFAATSSAATPQSSRAPSPSPATGARHARPALAVVDSTSDKATSSLIRRTLCPQAQQYDSSSGGGGNTASKKKPLEELLPPLTSSNEVDLQLYAFIAIVIREFVNPWYTKITPDHVFVDEVIRIIAHCTRAIEQRLRKVDLELLLLDQIPQLLEAHFTAYRRAHASLHAPPVAPDPRYVYHALHPHPALSPVPDPAIPSSIDEQRQNELVYRHTLVQKALAILLPADDLENASLRVLVGDIFSEMIVGKGISEKACEGRTWWNGITKLVEVAQEHLSTPQRRREEDGEGGGRATRRESRTVSVSAQTSEGKPQGARLVQYLHPSTAAHFLGRLFQYGLLALSTCRFLFIAVASSPAPSSSPSFPLKAATVPPRPTSSPRTPEKKPLFFEMHLFPTISTVLDLPARIPWLTGFLQLLQWLLPAGPAYLHNVDGLLKEHIPPHIPSLLLSFRTVLFPNNTLPPGTHATTASLTTTPSGSKTASASASASTSKSATPPSPSGPGKNPAAALAARAHCAQTILAALPTVVRKSLFGSDDAAMQQRSLERTVLEPLSGGTGVGDPWVLRHFVFAIMERVLLEVLPELADAEDGEGQG